MSHAVVAEPRLPPQQSVPPRRHHRCCPAATTAAPLPPPPPLPYYCSCCCHRHWLLSSVVVSRCDWLSWLVGGHGRWSWPLVFLVRGHCRQPSVFSCRHCQP